MSTDQKISDTTAPPQANDHVEQRASEIADRKGKSKVSNDEREEAYKELRSTAPPTAATKASH